MTTIPNEEQPNNVYVNDVMRDMVASAVYDGVLLALWVFFFQQLGLAALITLAYWGWVHR